jgi:hypothetical protein
MSGVDEVTSGRKGGKLMVFKCDADEAYEAMRHRYERF